MVGNGVFLRLPDVPNAVWEGLKWDVKWDVKCAVKCDGLNHNVVALWYHTVYYLILVGRV
jgi:hypothetical protein